MSGEDRRIDSLTAPLKRALIIILEDDEVVREKVWWVGKSGRKMYSQTIIALGERYLLKVVVTNYITRDRYRRSASLTDAGKYAALGIQREQALAQEKQYHRPPHRVSENAARFITEVVG